jgi:hypothetical protein
MLGALVLSPLIMSTMTLFGVIAGYIGWRRATKPIYRRSYADLDVPVGMTKRDHERALRRRRKSWRIVITILHALGGAVIGFGFLMYLARR